MRKILIGIIIGIIVLLGGYYTLSQEEIIEGNDLDSANKINQVENNIGDNFYISETDQYELEETITEGKIVEYDETYIHIMSGDLIEIFEYDGIHDGYYVGQKVRLVKGDESNYLKKSNLEDFTIAHTNMGGKIDKITGVIKSYTDELIILKTKNNKKVTVKYYQSNYDFKEGDEVEIYVIENTDQETYFSIFILKDKLILEVTQLTKNKNGQLLVDLIDQDAGEYRINLSTNSVEFDISKVKVGNNLTVYYNSIMESWPMQLDIELIRK